MKCVNKELEIIRNDHERGDQHEDTNKPFSKVKCIVALTNSDLFVMMNGKEDEIIENKPFDRCFTKLRF